MFQFLVVAILAITGTTYARFIEGNPCTKPGFFQLVDNSQHFYGCYLNKGDTLTVRHLSCRDGQFFNTGSSQCIPINQFADVVDDSNDGPPIEEPQIPAATTGGDIQSPTIPTQAPVTLTTKKSGDSNDDPETTDAPAPATEAPATTAENPVTTEEPATTAEKPVTTEEPATTAEKPVTTEEPATTAEKPVTTEEPATTAEKPVTTEEPATTAEKPVTTEEPATTAEKPVTTEEPSTQTTEKPPTSTTSSTGETTTDQPSTDNPSTDDDTPTDSPSTDDDTPTDSPSTDDGATTDDPSTDDGTQTDDPSTDYPTGSTVVPYKCPGEGFFPQNGDCNKFAYCVTIDGKRTYVELQCPEGQNFNPKVRYCQSTHKCDDGTDV